METAQSETSLFIANLAGGARNANQSLLAVGYRELISACQPDVLLLQEAAREIAACDCRQGGMFDFSITSGGERDLLGELARRLPDYAFFFTPIIWSNRHDHPAKWERVQLPEGMVRTQGSAVGIRRQTVTPLGYWTGQSGAEIEPMELSLPVGEEAEAYFGSRDREPRTATALRFRCGGRESVAWNVHLATMVGEREGDPIIDSSADRLRQQQLGPILRSCRSFKKEHQATRILIGGDFNANAVRLKSYLEAEACSIGYTVLVHGETRPGNRPATDNLVMESADLANCSPNVAILVGEACQRAGSAQADSTSHGRLIDRLVDDAGIDHFPVLARLTPCK